MKKKILLIGFNKQKINLIQKKVKNCIFLNATNINKFKDISFEAIITYNRRNFEKLYYSKDFNHFLEKIKWIHIGVSGIEKYANLKKFLKKKITITTANKLHLNQIADHAIGLLLSVTRNLHFVSKYGFKKKFQYLPKSLIDKKLMIIGYGNIGKQIAKRAYGFGMKINAVTLNSKPKKNRIIENFLSYRSYQSYLKFMDIIIFSLPLNLKSSEMYNFKTAKKYKKGVILINISRGEIVSENVIYKNLKNDNVLAYATDVLKNENQLKSSNKLFKLKNFLYTPHIANLSDNMNLENINFITDLIKNFLNKKLKKKFKLDEKSFINIL